ATANPDAGEADRLARIPSTEEAVPPGSVQGLMLAVDDIDAEHARLAAAGATVSPVDEQPWGRFTMLQDPDGNGWIVAQLTNPDEVKTR
ncbi:VOC family protein, partial [Sphingomonas sp. DC1200-1]|uniref:VOC family protein n=1 Tax=Sphingomonas sp. DC1200-1 TaxID=2804660 RepID=UPI003CECBDED